MTGTSITSNKPLVYTTEELAAIKEAKSLLLSSSFCSKHKRKQPFQDSEISLRHLAITSIINKNRAEEAALKYLQWVDVLKKWGIETFTDEQLTSPPPKSNHYLQSYSLAGRDTRDAQIFWINGGKNPIPNDMDEEALSIHAGIRYHMAVHADAITLRTGITFVIDVSKKADKKYGNEKRLREAHNVYPLRPQHIFIVGASRAIRLGVNALIKLGSIVSNSKVLKRIKFVNLDGVLSENGGTIDEESLPKHLKEELKKDNLENMMNDMNIQDNGDDEKEQIKDTSIIDWVDDRIANIPIPDI